MTALLRNLGARWTWLMAWRDSRASRRKLLLFSSSIVLGIAALVAIGSFGASLERAIRDQSKALLGADLVIHTRVKPEGERAEFLGSVPGESSLEINFASMIYFPRTEGTRLVQIRAIAGGFPFYGELETVPASAGRALKESGGALVDEALLLQFEAEVGDEIRIGKLVTRIAGKLLKVPGETMAFSTIAPRVYIRAADLDATGLLGEASLARYRTYYRLPEGVDAERLVEDLQPDLDRHQFGVDTVAERQRDLGRSMDNLYNFLNLVGFVALLLGGVGVASAIHVHVKGKLASVAVLRCLGCSAAQTLAIYLAQGMALGLVGAVFGSALGVVVQVALPRVVGDFIPIDVTFHLAWPSILAAAGIGFGACVLFALIPLLGVRRVSPLAAIRSSYESKRGPDPLLWLVFGLIGAFILAFALTHTRRWREGLGFAVGWATAFGALWVIAQTVAVLARRFTPAWLPFVWRQGLSNLHRPNNRTTLLLLSVGLGTFLILTLHLTQHSLLQGIVGQRAEGQANAILFDIQPDQREGVAAVLEEQGLPLLDAAPIVTMRIASIKGTPVEELATNRVARSAAVESNEPRERRGGPPRWILRREFRSTFSDRLRDSEQLVAGEWIASVPPETEVIPISVEDGVAEQMNVGLGDEIVWNVQGVPIKTRVASLRTVDWRRVQPNFFVVFPTGILEEAPSFHIIVTRVEDAAQSAALQREVVRQFPNVSAIDLTLIVRTLDAIIDKIAFVVRFMALFTVLTGLLVLAGAILTGRFQWMQESVLLRTLGASRRQIRQILLAEYLALGGLAAFTGIGLSLGATWALAKFVFKTDFSAEPLTLLGAFVIVCLLTTITGMAASRGVENHPPLEVLRREV
jgi:putative ABC transport system permease protein